MEDNDTQRLRKWETAINALLIAFALLAVMKLI